MHISPDRSNNSVQIYSSTAAIITADFYPITKFSFLPFIYRATLPTGKDIPALTEWDGLLDWCFLN